MLRFILLLFISQSIFAQSPKAPSDFLGYDLGTSFSRHHQVIDYFEHLNNASNLVRVEQYGVTNENRDLVFAYISSAENLAKLDEIQKNHESLENEDISIVWLSYNVHGNESSSTEASMLTAYQLITEHQDYLENVLVILDPCLNPDGRDRYVNWYNQQNSSILNPTPFASEHDEPWPGGRVNHYLFDLNRDWAWLTQVESQQRIAVYNQWMPHVHVDFHEQGINNPYYFAPAAEPMHELISDWQREYQFDQGKNHASYFDENGWLYFTREDFDLLYPSYGDTYPIFNGAIGMTYEQAGHGVAGLGIEKADNDTLTLTDRILHHHTTGLSTIELAHKRGSELISEYKTFMERNDFEYKSFALTGNRESMNSLVSLLDKQSIKYTVGNGGSISGYSYSQEKSASAKNLNSDWIIVNTDQHKGTLVHVLFEPNTKLSDSLTYDITSWSVPYAYGLECIASKSIISGEETEFNIPMGHRSGEKQYAYLIPWEGMSGARILSQLLQDKIKVRVSESPFSFGDDSYERGTLIILNDGTQPKDIDALIPMLCNKYGVDYGTTSTGMVDTGKDFGSSSVRLLKNLKVGLVTGQGTFANQVGEIWHYFENDLNYPLTKINSNRISKRVLSELDVLILPAGWMNLDNDVIESWIQGGGKLIAVGGAVNLLPEDVLTRKESEEDETEDDEDGYSHVPHCNLNREFINDEINGAIYRCKVDNSHPLAFGYSEEYFTLKRSSSSYDLLDEGNVVYIEDGTEETAGFVGKNIKDSQDESLIFGIQNVGRGSIVIMVDNPLFRAFWENGKLFMANAIFICE